MSKQKKKKKPAPVPRYVYEVIVTKNEEIVFDKPVAVRRHSELNGIANNIEVEVGDILEIWAKLVRKELVRKEPS